MDEKQAHVWVTGRVQGVFFRAHTRDEARKLGLRGWVRNLPDGRVEAVFQGDPTAIEDAVRWCRTGPPFASVTDVQVAWEPLDASQDIFEVRYG